MPLSMWIVSTCDSAPEILEQLNGCRSVNVQGIVVRKSVVPPDPSRHIFCPNDPWESDLLSNSPIDILLCAGYPRKIGSRVLSRCQLGGFNVHPSLLPLYAGKMPRQQIYKDQYPWAGITVHELTEHFDAGPIVLQLRCALPVPYSLEHLARVEEQLTVSAIQAFLRLIESTGSPASIPQETTQLNLGARRHRFGRERCGSCVSIALRGNIVRADTFS